MASRSDLYWPPHNPPKWECTAGLECDEGFHVLRGEEGHADTAQRCPCVNRNLVENRRLGGQERAERQAKGRGELRAV